MAQANFATLRPVRKLEEQAQLGRTIKRKLLNLKSSPSQMLLNTIVGHHSNKIYSLDARKFTPEKAYAQNLLVVQLSEPHLILAVQLY